MNAKKIMGAVLVALLAAALFVGAGAAADEKAAGTVFLYQLGSTIPAGIEAGVYSFGEADVEVSSTGVLPLNIEKFVDGAKYSNGTAYITVKLPNAGFTAVGNPTGDKYDAMANGLIASQAVQFTATPVVSGTSATVVAIIIYDEDGVPTRYAATPEFIAGSPATLDLPANTLKKGTYQIQAVLGSKGSAFVGTVEPAQLYGQKYSFTVYSTEPTLTASADTVLIGNFITVTITGKPGDSYYLEAPGFTIPTDRQLVGGLSPIAIQDGEAVVVQLPNSGKITVYLKAGDDSGKQTILLKAYDATASPAAGAKKASANVKIEKGAITAFADEDSFFVGNPIGLHGTTTAGSDLFFYIEGTNFGFTQIDIIPNIWAENGELEVVKGEWTAKFESSVVKSVEGKKLVAGTYTVVVSTVNASALTAAEIAEAGSKKDAVMNAVSGTAAVTLTQPFLTGIEAADVAIQGTDYKVTGTAYSASEVRLYVFGTNFFGAAKADVDEDDETFEYTLKKAVTKDMAPGTYFYLIQHPMGDKLFNVWNGTAWGAFPSTYVSSGNPVHEADFFYAATGVNGVNNVLVDSVLVFNAYERGTNYAAQALLNEISGQNIDDIFVQGTFKVEAQKLTINPIPAEVVKGTALTVSGTTNSGEGVEVIVNVLAGTFGATVKGDENAATFLTAKAVTEEDGTFAAAIDTSKLELGNYIVTVELNGQMYDSAAVEIVDKAPVTPPADDKPDTPVTPPADDKPTEPETPGFGALAALAGLGAVAVLLLRRE